MTGLFGNGEIELYGYRFRITPDPIQESLVSVFPGKIVIGDNRRVDDPIASSYVMQDWTGGLLKRWMDPTIDFDRFFWSTCATWYTRQLTLGPLVRFSPPPGWGDTSLRNVRAGCVYGAGNGRQYLGYDEQLAYLDINEVVQQVGAVASLGNVITKMLVYRMLTGANAGQSRIVCAFINTGTGVTGYATSDGATISAGTGTCAALTIWDGKLVRCDDNGALQYTTDLVGWFNLPGQNVVPLTKGSVNDLAVYPDGFWGLDEVQIATSTGLYWYDEIGQLVRQTRLTGLPAMPNSGRPLVNHRDNIYIPTPALQLLRYTGSTLSPEGLDRDDGLPANYRGTLQWAASTLNFLVAASQATSVIPASAPIFGGDETTYASTIPGTAGYSTIFIQPRIGGGWHTLYQTNTTGQGMYWVGASDADGNYRLFFGVNGQVGIIDLYPDLLNPLDNTLQQFRQTDQHITPWNEMGWSEITKLALKQKFGIKGTGINSGGALCTTTQYPACNIVVEYGLDYDETTWYTLATITSGPTPPAVAFGTGALGVPFKAMRYRYTLNRCGNTGHTPTLVWSTLTFLKEMDARFGYRMMLDLTTSEQGITPPDQAALLRRMADPADLGANMGVFRGWVNGKFVQRNVKVSELVGKVKGGNKQSGVYSVALVSF